MIRDFGRDTACRTRRRRIVTYRLGQVEAEGSTFGRTEDRCVAAEPIKASMINARRNREKRE